jgi:hypothetical protein
MLSLILTVAVAVALVAVVDATVAMLDGRDRKAGRAMSGTGCGFKGCGKGGFNGRLLF